MSLIVSVVRISIKVERVLKHNHACTPFFIQPIRPWHIVLDGLVQFRTSSLPWRRKPTSLFPLEGRHDNPLQDSFLENPMNRVAWWATVHSVAKSRTWQSTDNSYLSGAFGNSNQHLLFKTYPTLLCFSSDTSEHSFSVSLVPSNIGFPQGTVIIIFFSHSIYTPWIILHILRSWET